jgi:hypothetical protein
LPNFTIKHMANVIKSILWKKLLQYY